MNILVGFVTQISLILNPTGEGSGSIHIYVTWNTGHDVWADFELNPILES